jgi:RNA polymerase primary sigma factor
MAKAKDTAKEAPKARTSKAKEKAAEKALLAGRDGRNSGTARC